MLKATLVIEELTHTFMLKKHYQNGKFVFGSVTVVVFKEKKKKIPHLLILSYLESITKMAICFRFSNCWYIQGGKK